MQFNNKWARFITVLTWMAYLTLTLPLYAGLILMALAVESPVHSGIGATLIILPLLLFFFRRKKKTVYSFITIDSFLLFPLFFSISTGPRMEDGISVGIITWTIPFLSIIVQTCLISLGYWLKKAGSDKTIPLGDDKHA